MVRDVQNGGVVRDIVREIVEDDEEREERELMEKLQRLREKRRKERGSSGSGGGRRSGSSPRSGVVHDVKARLQSTENLGLDRRYMT